MLRKIVLPVLAALAAACVGPSATDYAAAAREGLVLSLSVTPAAISPGDTARLVARLENRNRHPVRLAFPTGCQILPYVESAEGTVVYPYGGGWACTQAFTELALGPREVKEQVLRWTAESYDHDRKTFAPISSPLPPGTYRAYAVLSRGLGGEEVELRSNTETVTVR
ncbi:MAG: BsuPI-related putative proteinase inhibitor [Gemmatimonadota bacterium]